MKSRLITNLRKKGQISPVFKYIFVLVVGAIILIFFLRFALRAESTGQEVIKAEVLHALDASLQAFSVSEYSSVMMPDPPWPQLIHMKFGTGSNCGKFTIEGQKFFVAIERVLFGPSEIKAKQIQAWTLSWNFPFRVTNLFFLVNPQRSKYYLVYDQGDSADLSFVKVISSYPPETSIMDHLPASFDVKYTPSETEPKSKLKVADMAKVNYFKPVRSGVSQGLKGSYIEVSPACREELRTDEMYKCYGTVTFYDGGENTGKSTFIGREMMFGAIMADSIEAYECQYGRALDELKRMTNIYVTKTQKMSGKKQGCATKYNSMVDLLNKMETAVETVGNSPTFDNAGALSSLANSIKNLNDQLGDGDCEVIY